MAEQPLVSIIIPTYNRAHLIGETLDSVLAQTYTNWECIVVDDGSTDATDALMAKYCAKDSRIRYYHRPDEHLPGGNGARNYGFKMSRGEYIQWFDSDDLMVENKIALKVETFQKNEVDFVISQTTYLDTLEVYKYNYNSEDINLKSYTMEGISWITNDMILKRWVCDQVKFNENLKSGQEGNFSYKLLLTTNKVIKLPKYLSKRRFHPDSITAKRKKSDEEFLATTFNSNWITIEELFDNGEVPVYFKKFVLKRGIKLFYKHGNIKLTYRFQKRIFDVFGFNIIYFYLGILSNYFFDRYLLFYKKIK